MYPFHYQSGKPYKERSFVPPIRLDDDERNANPNASELVEDGPLCKDLSDKLNIDPYFLTKDGWDSNGFLLSRRVDSAPLGKAFGMSIFYTRYIY
jgi:hypothetical protein